MRCHSSSLGLALVSAAALVFEIGLSRLFAIQQFHHFAFVVVSLAMMGSAASGILLAARSRAPSLPALAGGLAASVLVAYLILNFLPFDSYSLAWDGRQVLLLGFYFLAAGTPFLFAGWVGGACLASAGPQAHRPYAASLIGASFGSLAAMLALAWIPPEGLVFLAAALALAGAAALATRRVVRLIHLLAALIAIALALRLPSFLTLRLSPYKPLVVAGLAPDARRTLTLYSAASRLDVLEDAGVRAFPGLSLNAGAALPEQVALFLDGDGPWPITPLSPDDPAAAQIAEHMPSTIAYRLRPGAESLILDPGSGLDALLALAAGAGHIWFPGDDPLVISALQSEYRAFSLDLIGDPRLTLVPRSSRAALRTGGRRYDIVHWALSDGYRPVTSGAFSLTEDYLLTREAVIDGLLHLRPGGILTITRWLQTPPSEDARAFATVLAALREIGVADPYAHVLAFRSMRTATIVASPEALSPEDLSAARLFLETNGYDPIVLPGIRPEELNRYNRIPTDEYHALYTALLRNPSATIANYDFNLEPTTDDRPFFFHFFRWRQTPGVLARLGQTWQPFGGSGYLVLLALTALMLALAIPFILLPLALLRRRRGPASSSTARPARPLLYFACLGAGYLLVEIPLIQRLTLLLDRPSLSLATVLFSLLLASGAGSLLSPRISLRLALGALVICIGLTALVLPAVTRAALPLPFVYRLGIASALVAPAGLLMGIPYAAGLRRLEQDRPGLIPWAWAVNGAVSGVSGVLTALVALDWGHTAALVLGAAAYAAALTTAPAGRASEPRG